MDEVVTVSWARSVHDMRPKRLELPWWRLAARLTGVGWGGPGFQGGRPIARPDLVCEDRDEARRRKARLPAWLPVQLSKHARRRNAAAVDRIFLLALDYDAEGVSIDQEWERWDGYARCLHTSWSHTEDAPKFRIVLPLKVPVKATMWGRCHEHVQGLAPIDPVTSNPDRLYFLPALKSHDSPWESRISDGAWLDLDPRVLPPSSAERAAELARQRAEHLRRLQSQRRDRDYSGELLATDPTERRALAMRLGARIYPARGGERATGMLCPSCGQPSVWYLVAPVRWGGAACNHARSCGWTGPLAALR